MTLIPAEYLLARIFRHSCRPSRPGIWMSATTTDGWFPEPKPQSLVAILGLNDLVTIQFEEGPQHGPDVAVVIRHDDRRKIAARKRSWDTTHRSPRLIIPFEF